MQSDSKTPESLGVASDFAQHASVNSAKQNAPPKD